MGPAGGAGTAAAQSVRRPGAGARDAARAGTAGGGRPRAGGGRVWVIPARASHACATSSSVAPWRSRGSSCTPRGPRTARPPRICPIIDLLKGYFHLDDREDRATIRDQVRTHLHRLDDALTPTAPAFLTLLDVPVEDPQWQALEAAQRRQRTLDALKWVLVRESQVQPVLLLCRGPALDRYRDPGVPGHPGGQPPDRPAPPAGQLSARIPTRLGQQDVLHAPAAGPAATGQRRGALASPAGG